MTQVRAKRLPFMWLASGNTCKLENANPLHESGYFDLRIVSGGRPDPGAPDSVLVWTRTETGTGTGAVSIYCIIIYK